MTLHCISARRTLSTAGVALGLMAGLAPRSAAAAPCSALPNVIYGIGGSAHVPVIGKIAARLAGQSSPVSVVYASPGACFGYGAFADPTYKLTGTATSWSSSGQSVTCELPANGVRPDFGAAGVFPASCSSVGTQPAGTKAFDGPVTAWSLFVPQQSTQQSISAEAAYFVFGFGAAGQVSPWTDEASLVVRNSTSAAQIAVALAAGLPPDRFKGTDAQTNSRSIQLVAGATNKEAALGFASVENVDANRSGGTPVRALAFKAKGQSCAYLPDSTANSFDKSNVREGTYWLWSQSHYTAPVDASGRPTNPLVATFLANVSTPDQGALDVLSTTSNVPKCAMNVWRDADNGALYSYQPSEPCGCYFEKKATGRSTCATCTQSSECPSSSPVCRFGFCEVR
jgi:hypothetical protein